jgi:endoglucanase
VNFELRHGVNISHWLSQSERRGAERRAWFNEADVERIASSGFDHLRFPVDEEQLWDGRGRREPEAFELLEQALGWCERAELRAIVDLHIVRSHDFNAAGRPLFTDVAEQDKFCALWRDLSAALARWPLDQVAYELLNEPVAHEPGDWNRLAARALAEVRAHEPGRFVVIDSNGFADPRAFSALRVPADEHLVLSFHFYDPLLFTHYRAPWSTVGAYNGPIDYPGELVSRENWDALPPDVRFAARAERVFAPADIERVLAPALALAKETGLPLLCGELGALATTPEAARERWYRDVLAALAQHKIPWTVWDYKGDFGVFDSEGRPTLVHRVLSDFLG